MSDLGGRAVPVAEKIANRPRVTGLTCVLVPRWPDDLVADGICRRVSHDTYDRAIERYGGADGMRAAELFVPAGSEAVGLLSQSDLDRTLLGVYTVDDLLTGLGLASAERLDCYRAGLADRRPTADERRRRQVEPRTAIGAWDLPVEVADRLDKLARTGELGKPRTHLARSHGYCDRLPGCGHPPERKVPGLLTRTLESPRRAPLDEGPA